MRKPYVTYQHEQWAMMYAVARLFDVPLRLVGALPRRQGRRRSAYRHRNAGRA